MPMIMHDSRQIQTSQLPFLGSIAFENALSDAGFKWRRVAVDARGNDGGPEHTIYIARAGIEDRPLRTEMP